MKSRTIDQFKVLLGTFVIHCMMFGSARLSPILFVESITYYNVDRSRASFPFVLSFILVNLSGLLVGYLQQVFGTQVVVTVGCVTSTLSIAACFFATDILTVTILWGFIFGLGCGLSTLTLPSLLNRHFPQNRSLANGIFYCGSSFGGLFVPVLYHSYSYYYGMAGSYLLVSGLIAQSIPACVLLMNHFEIKLSIAVAENKINATDQRIHSNFIDNLKQETYQEKSTDTVVEDEKVNCKNVLVASDYSSEAFSKNLSSKPDKNPEKSVKTHETNVKTTDSVSRKDSFFLKNFDIFINPVFITILVWHVFGTWVKLSFWTILIDMLRDKGIGIEQETHFIACLPIAEFIGHIVCGYAFDKSPWTTVTKSCICSVCMALSLLMFNFTNDHYFLLAIEATVAFFLSTTMLLGISFIHEFIEDNKKVMALSCRMTLYAPCILTIPPMIGYFRGNSGTYESIIYIMSGVSLLCGATSFFVPYFAKRQKS